MKRSIIYKDFTLLTATVLMFFAVVCICIFCVNTQKIDVEAVFGRTSSRIGLIRQLTVEYGNGGISPDTYNAYCGRSFCETDGSVLISGENSQAIQYQKKNVITEERGFDFPSGACNTTLKGEAVERKHAKAGGEAMLCNASPVFDEIGEKTACIIACVPYHGVADSAGKAIVVIIMVSCLVLLVMMLLRRCKAKRTAAHVKKTAERESEKLFRASMMLKCVI